MARPFEVGGLWTDSGGARELRAMVPGVNGEEPQDLRRRELAEIRMGEADRTGRLRLDQAALEAARALREALGRRLGARCVTCRPRLPRSSDARREDSALENHR
jgi:hypothetical protein